MKKLVISLLIFLALSASAIARERVALVVGNAGYQNIGKLENPYNDATKMAARLKRLDFDVVKAVNVTRSEMIKAIKIFREKLDGAKVGVLFYAGHGVQVGGKMYLMPVDAGFQAEEDLEFDSVDLSNIIKVMNSKKRVSIIFMDACRNNPLAESYRDIGKVPYTPDLSRAAKRRPGKKGTRAAVNRTAQRGKRQYGFGQAISWSTSNGTLASDGVKEASNSPYTRALLRYIGKPNLPFTKMIKKVNQEVKNKTNGSQEPWVSSNLSNDFYFKKVASLNPQRALRSLSCMDEVFDASDRRDESRLRNLAASYKGRPCGNVALRRLDGFCNTKKDEAYAAYFSNNLKFIQKFVKRYSGTECAKKIGRFTASKLQAKQKRARIKTPDELCRQVLVRAQRSSDIKSLKSLQKKYPQTQCAKSARKSMIEFCMNRISSAERWGDGEQIRRLKTEFAGTACEEKGQIALENICMKRLSRNKNKPIYLRKLMQEYPRTMCVKAVKVELARLGNRKNEFIKRNRKNEFIKRKYELLLLKKALARRERELAQRNERLSKQGAALAKRKKQLAKQANARLCLVNVENALHQKDGRRLVALSKGNSNKVCAKTAKKYASLLCKGELGEAIQAGRLSWLKDLSKRFETTGCAKTADLVISSILQKRELRKKAQLSRQKIYKSHKQELKRVGCYTGKIDGKWDGKAKQAWKDFLKLANLNTVRSDIDPNSDTLASLLNWQGKGYACPFFCQQGEFLDNYGRCKQSESEPVKKLKPHPLLRKKPRARPKIKRKAKTRRKVKRKARPTRKAKRKARLTRKVKRKARPTRKAKRKAKPTRKVKRKAKPIRKVKRKAKPIRKVKRKAKPIRKVKRKAKPIRRYRRTSPSRPTVMTGIR